MEPLPPCSACGVHGLLDMAYVNGTPLCPACAGKRLAGRKDDQEKARYDLLPPRALHSVVEVLTFGARKYAPDNWRMVPDRRRRYFAAALRHLWAWWRGEMCDRESGVHHLAHAACCILFILDEEPELE